MALLFPYKLLPAKGPVISLNGRAVRPKPIIPITLIGPGGTFLDLTQAPEGEAVGVGGTAVRVRYAEVTLRLATNTERREWRAWVGFTAANLHRPLLGFAGFLQFFSALFLGDQEHVELTVNGLYPGT